MNKIEINRYWGRVIDTLNDALMIISKEGKILAANRSFEEMTGYSTEEITGKSCRLLKCDACEKAIKDDSSGWCILFEQPQGGIRKCRCEIARKDGTFITALKNASVLFDEDGSLLGAVETLTDISELDRLDKRVEFLTQQLDETDGYCGTFLVLSKRQRIVTLRSLSRANPAQARSWWHGRFMTGAVDARDLMCK
jgi:two-component system response regulator HydG